MSPCTWGDVYAYKISLIAGLTGSYSVQLSDFSDSFPNGGATRPNYRVSASTTRTVG
jgi:hypothetical protein